MTISDEIEESLAGAFVLSASLYFQAVSLPSESCENTLIRALHDLSKDLAGASEAGRASVVTRDDLNAGIADLIHNLGDVADLTAACNQVELATLLQDHRASLEALGEGNEDNAKAERRAWKTS